jgi:endonuclease/exonuclease/phosphatase family metal-dependent hydrolase
VAKSLKIASMNLLNLSAPGQVTHNGKVNLDEKTYADKVAWTAARLRTLKADIFGFQECWSKSALFACFEKAGLAHDYEIVARDAEPGRVQVAAAVRKKLPILSDPSEMWIEKFPRQAQFIKRPPKPGEPINTIDVRIDRFSRPILNLAIKVGSTTTLRFFVIHLKSKLATELDADEATNPSIRKHSRAIGEAISTIRRTAEVAALRIILNKELKETRTPVAVVGDLNDGHLSTTAQILSAQPPYKLFFASQIGSRPTKGADVGLYSAQTLQQYRSIRDVYYTYDHESILDSLDHIFVSEEFYDHSPFRIWSFHDMITLNDHLHTRADHSKVESDHGLIMARFDFKPAGAEIVEPVEE